MGKRRKFFDTIVGGESDQNIPFDRAVSLLEHLGFEGRPKGRTSGSHRVFTMDGVEELINLQNVGGKCKPYQVGQMRAVLGKYNLREEL